MILVIAKTKWFRRQQEKHGFAADMTLWISYAAVVCLVLEALWVAWPRLSLGHFLAVLVADFLYYLRSFGALIISASIGYMIGQKNGNTIVGWLVFIVLAFLIYIGVDTMAREIPYVSKQFYLFDKFRSGIGEPRDWF